MAKHVQGFSKDYLMKKEKWFYNRISQNCDSTYNFEMLGFEYKYQFKVHVKLLGYICICDKDFPLNSKIYPETAEYYRNLKD
ncbi:hypothetical protein DICPUDRAFT_154003 [Dictyostelium purpureum]|uniref:Uncharacterized protein n=1 Tax=Dictyostelium purpureum TaxID=5786 RepID=F0ZQB4_DICPU|nr:uncharacterized protein DICPUDRAFT_154003 [Dictyostelium purpureum]EGC33873.1 hypothetical protein DICPUDRAFT_154003 [Dictyostelium purpureum]|eukprot:XP_003289611.1 hypothetical protein DICPUDRAFT_154003 [Dictyostelium purpureum]